MDIFDASSGRWSTAALSLARANLAATSLPSQGLALFAGDLSFLSGLCFCFALLVLRNLLFAILFGSRLKLFYKFVCEIGSGGMCCDGGGAL